MKLNKYLILSLSLFIVLGVTACKKAGTGGENTIAAFPKHHGKAIPNAVVYIKYGTNEFPGEDVSQYDDNKVAEGHGGEAHAHFEELRKGKYYIYAVGYDSAIAEAVKGGVPVELKEKAEEKDVEIPVTE